MWRLFLKPMLIVGIGITGAACVDDGTAAPQGTYQPAPRGTYQPAPTGYYQPAPTAYNNPGYATPYYNNPYYNSGYSPHYTTVTVTNRGQNGNRDEVVQQQVACGSQYYDGYRTRTAPRC